MFDHEIDTNKRWWNAATHVHARSRFYDLDGFKAGACSLLPTEVRELGDVAGKRMLHLQCHFGMDTLSWARRGADITGVDFSPDAVALARSLSEELSIPARFIESNLYDLPKVLDERFDIVYTSYGAICWLPDIRKWGELVGRYLRPGGTFYMVEGHPFTEMIEDDTEELRMTNPYFRNGEPLRFESDETYTDSDTPMKERVTYSWVHTVGDILNSLIDAGLRIEFLHEFPFGFFARHPLMERREAGLWYFKDPKVSIPMTISIRARKE